MRSNKVSLNPSSIVRILGIVAFLLVLASVGLQLISYLTGHNNIYGLVGFFFVDAEQNLPTFFSTLLLIIATLLLDIITILKRKQKDSYASDWTVLTFGFLLMAVDEATSLHESLIEPIRILIGNGNLGIFYFAWVILGIALIFVLALFFLKFLFHLPQKTKVTFLLATSLFIGGAIGFELIGGSYFELHGENLTYSMIATVEESLEMAGIIIFIGALLVYIDDSYKEVQFGFNTIRGDANHLDENTKAGS